MPATTDHHNQGSFLNRISIRRNQFAGADNNHDQFEHVDLELFQKHVSDRFCDLLSPPPFAADSPSHSPPPEAAEILSISWLRNLLDAFLCCEAEFKAVLVSGGRDPSQFSRPPLDRLIPDLLDRSVKALDVCNAVTHGVDLLHHWHKLAQIAVTSLSQHPVGEGQVRRAKKALTTLLTLMISDDKENNANTTTNNNSTHGTKWADRTRSFSRRGAAPAAASVGGGSAGKISNIRPLSWSVSKSWSAAKQIQIMSANLAAPRGGDQSTGLASPVYIMNTIIVFVMWTLVAAIPCQERNGLPAHFQIPRNLGWAHALIGLQEKIGEEWKKKEKKGTAGLLLEVRNMEKAANSLVEFADGFVFPLEEERAAELAAKVAEMAEVCQRMEEGLLPLHQQVREVFHRIVRSRAEVLDVVDHQVSKHSAPAPY